VEIGTLKEVQEIIQLGKSKGFLTLDEINRLLPTDTINAAEIDDVLALLGALDIDLVDDPAPPGDDSADGLDEEPLALAEGDEIPEAAVAVVDAAAKPARSAQVDPVRLYFDEMGRIPLLGREGEVEIARRIEEATHQVRNEAFASPLALAYVLDLAARLESGEIDLAAIAGTATRSSRARTPS
jgi:RNA polymerase primary sigma factor